MGWFWLTMPMGTVQNNESSVVHTPPIRRKSIWRQRPGSPTWLGLTLYLLSDGMFQETWEKLRDLKPEVTRAWDRREGADALASGYPNKC